MNREYYQLRLNNSRLIIDGDKKENGCLMACPTYNKEGKISEIKKPFLVIAERVDEHFVDFISGKKIKFDDSIVSRGNFGIPDINSINEDDLVKMEDEYLEMLKTVDEEVLDKYDKEASGMLIHIESQISCYEYNKMSSLEVSKNLKKIDNPKTIERYMEEINKVERGIIGTKKATKYLDLRRKFLSDYEEKDEDSASKYINVFKSRYRTYKK